MHLRLAIPLLCAACSFDSSTPREVAALEDADLALADSQTFDSSLPSGTYRKSITLNPEGLTEDLSDFVVAVVLDSDSDLAVRAQADGSDIHFTSLGGARLEFELEEFVAASGKLVAWVQVPAISMSESTQIYLYYGESQAARDAMPTWSGGFAGVWHFAEDPTVPMPLFADSVTATYPASASGSERPSPAAGIAGPALLFDGVDDSLTIQDSANSALDFGTGSFSYSTWVLVTEVAGQYDMPWWKGGASAGQGGYDIELGTNNWTVYVSDGNGPPSSIVGGNFGDVSEFLGRWVHLAVVVNRETDELRVFADGMRKATRDISAVGALGASYAARIGSSTYIFKGRIDETRVYKTPLSDEWIRTVHANLSSPATFLDVGPQEGSSPN